MGTTFWKWWDRIQGVVGLLLLAASTAFSAGSYYGWNQPSTQRKDYVLVGGGPVTPPWWLIALGGLGFLMLLTSWSMMWIRRREKKKANSVSTTTADNTIRWIKNPFLASDGKTASLSIEYAETGARLRIFIDYSSYIRAMTVVGWSKRIRKPLWEVRDFVRGQRAVFPLLQFSDLPGGARGLCWGIPEMKDGVLQNPLALGKQAVRIAFIGDDGSEQYFSFFMVRNAVQDGQQTVAFIDGDDLSIFERWAAED